MKESLESGDFFFLLLGFVQAYGGWPCKSAMPGIIQGAEVLRVPLILRLCLFDSILL